MEITTKKLAQIFLFSSLSQEDLESVRDYIRTRKYLRKEIIFHEGDRLLAQLHIVLDGQLIVQKSSSTGKETVLRQLLAGEIFAAPALFGDGIAPATVTALEDSTIITIEREVLLDQIQSQPEIALKILSCFNQRLQEMHFTIHGLISERAVVRIIRLIQYKVNRYGFEPENPGKCLKVKLPYQQISRMVGITYEECVRIFKKELSSAIDYERGGKITIKDYEKFNTLASESEG
ncbi:MAG: Crp/Fnr family transcriptional regulator [Cyanophyceae cyanobacterium]